MSQPKHPRKYRVHLSIDAAKEVEALAVADDRLPGAMCRVLVMEALEARGRFQDNTQTIESTQQ